jgi:tetratricopeptide (TPR) repeat protein
MFNFERILAFFKAEPRTPLDAALRKLAHGQAVAALEMFDALLGSETDPGMRAQLANKRGVALVSLERRDEARASFASALKDVAEYAPALVNLGNLEFEVERYEEAAAFYLRAIASDENLASAHRHLALAYRRMGRGGDALREFSRARRLEGRAARKQRR